MKDILNNQYIVVGLFTLIGTIIGGFLVPWYKYFLDVKKERRDDRKKLLLKLRQNASSKEFNREKIINSQEYYSIRPYLSKKFTDNFEYSAQVYLGSKTIISGFKASLLNELMDVENSWGITLKRSKKKPNYITKGRMSVRIELNAPESNKK